MSDHRRWSAALVLSGFLWAQLPSAAAQEWTRYRGPNGSGVSNATSIPGSWSRDDYNWRIALRGVGHSSPVLWGKRIFITSGEEKTGARIALCLAADDGRVIWSRRTESATHGKHQLNSFASSTPAVDAERVYFLWMTPGEYAAVARNHQGKLLWRRVLGTYRSGHGSGVSPILHDGMLIIANDQQGESSLIALDCRTGETRWRVPRNTKVAYSTPCVYRPKGRKPELIFTSWVQGITAINPANGKTNWEVLVFDEKHTETAISSPIVVGENVLGTCGYLGYAAHSVAVRPNDSAPRKAQTVYRVDRGAPLTTTPLAASGLLFLWADGGIVTCVDAETGVPFWRKRVGGTYYGSPVVAGNRLYCMSAQGEAVVLAASKDYRLIARIRLGEGSHSTPAIADGVMYLRTFSHLISLGGKK